MEASVRAHQGDLLLLVPEPKSERAGAEGYATAQVREQEEAVPTVPPDCYTLEPYGAAYWFRLKPEWLATLT
jgi:hypothetical protein